MNAFLEKNATRRNILILIVLMVIMEILFSVILPKGEHAKSLDTQFVYNADDAYEIMGNYTDSMRHTYILGEVTLDLIFPIIYTLLFSFLIFFLFKNTTLALFPLIQMIFDYLENTGIVIMLSAWPNKLMGLASATSVFSLIKWTLAGLTILLIFVGLVRRMIFRNKRSE